MDDPCPHTFIECYRMNVILCLVFLYISAVVKRYARVSIISDILRAGILMLFLSMVAAVLPTSIGTILTTRFKNADTLRQLAELPDKFELHFKMRNTLDSDDEDDDDFLDTDEEFLMNEEFSSSDLSDF